MTQKEEIINKELKKKRIAIEHIKKELIFIKRWLAEDPGRMEEYLRGRKAGLEEVLTILK